MASLNIGQGRSGSFWQNVFSWKVLFYLSWIISGAEQILRKFSIRFLKKKPLPVFWYNWILRMHPNILFQLYVFQTSRFAMKQSHCFLTSIEVNGNIPQSFVVLIRFLHFSRCFSIDFKWIFILFALQLNTRKTLWDPFKVCSSYFWHLASE